MSTNQKARILTPLPEPPPHAASSRRLGFATREAKTRDHHVQQRHPEPVGDRRNGQSHHYPEPEGLHWPSASTSPLTRLGRCRVLRRPLPPVGGARWGSF